MILIKQQLVLKSGNKKMCAQSKSKRKKEEIGCKYYIEERRC